MYGAIKPQDNAFCYALVEPRATSRFDVSHIITITCH